MATKRKAGSATDAATTQVDDNAEVAQDGAAEAEVVETPADAAETQDGTTETQEAAEEPAPEPEAVETPADQPESLIPPVADQEVVEEPAPESLIPPVVDQDQSDATQETPAPPAEETEQPIMTDDAPGIDPPDAQVPESVQLGRSGDFWVIGVNRYTSLDLLFNTLPIGTVITLV